MKSTDDNFSRARFDHSVPYVSNVIQISNIFLWW